MANNKISYTSKTYDTIFKDLVSAIPDLTDKWKNFSDDDPGIVLIKLMSSVGDMLCYNMDYQVNETFPQSALQRRHAQKSYDLIGYKMHWYRSATCNLTLTLNIPTSLQGSEFSVVIPEWTTILSASGVPYTIIGPDYTRTLSISSSVSSDTITNVLAVQGATKILSPIYKSNITSDGRIYIPDMNVDEDIQNNIDYPHMSLDTYNATTNVAITTGTSRWVKVANLLDKSDAGMYYEFRVDDNDQPYIQLNDGWQDYVDSSNTGNEYLVLKYLVSQGSAGSVRENVGFTFNTSIESNPATIDLAKYITIYNTQSDSGKNPETVEEAAINGPREARTLGVAITLEDYEILAETIDGIRACKAVDSNISIEEKTYESTITVPTSTLAITHMLDTDNGNQIVPNTVQIEFNVAGSSDPPLILSDDGEGLLETDLVGVDVHGLINYSTGQFTLFNASDMFPAETYTVEASYELTPPPYTVLLYLIANDYKSVPESTISKLDTMFTQKSIISINQLYADGKIQPIPFNVAVYSYEPLTITETNKAIQDAIKNALYEYFDSSARDFGERFRYPDMTTLIQNSSDRIKYSQLDYPTRDVQVNSLSYPMLGPVVVNFAEDADYQWLMENVFDEDVIGDDVYDSLIEKIFGATGGVVDFHNILNGNTIDNVVDRLLLPTEAIGSTEPYIDIPYESGNYYDFHLHWWCSRPDLVNVDPKQPEIWGSITRPYVDTQVTLYAIVDGFKSSDDESYPETLSSMCLVKCPFTCTIKAANEN